MVKLYNAPNPKTLLYNISLITGSTVLLYFPAVPFVIVAFFALGTLRPLELMNGSLYCLALYPGLFPGWLAFSER